MIKKKVSMVEVAVNPISSNKLIHRGSWDIDEIVVSKNGGRYEDIGEKDDGLTRIVTA